MIEKMFFMSMLAVMIEPIYRAHRLQLISNGGDTVRPVVQALQSSEKEEAEVTKGWEGGSNLEHD